MSSSLQQRIDQPASAPPALGLGKHAISKACWLIGSITRRALLDGDHVRAPLFNFLQALGWHLLPVHFYSPVPDTSELPERLWRLPVDLANELPYRECEQLELLEKLSGYSDELDDVPDQPQDEGGYSWANPAFWPGDAAVYYAMIRHFASNRIIEVGSGFSTQMASRAAARNGAELIAIEPNPRDFLKTKVQNLARLIEEPVQAVPLELFDELDAGDILFIDSSHVCKIGSDVNHLVLRVLPRLKVGVLVHFHDIYLPWEMPRNWVLDLNCFWNEQYLLQAFLTCNSDFEIVLGNQLLEHKYPDRFRQAFPCIPDGYAPGGGSFWIRRTSRKDKIAGDRPK